MRDFSEVVRRNLGRLPLEQERAEEIVAELATQMEDACKEALARGCSETRAEAEAMTQLGDWEKLRRSIISSERGAKVLWPHPWAIPRAAGWMALAIVAALCLVPGFRRALRAAPSAWSQERPGVSQSELRELAARGMRDHDARLVAFAAIHLNDGPEASRLAEQAIAMDPSLTWIGLRFTSTIFYRDVDRDVWVKRLADWDSRNAIPLLLIPETLFRRALPGGGLGPHYDPQVVRLAETTEWGREMQAAFDAPQYDNYYQRRFKLEKSVLRNAEGDRPEQLAEYSSYAIGIPDSSQILRYAGLVTRVLGPEAERAGHNDEATKMYWSVARFGQRMEQGASWYFERWTAYELQSSAYAALASLAARTRNKTDEEAFLVLEHRAEGSAAAELAQVQREAHDTWQSSARAATTAWFASLLVLLSAVACVAWFPLVGFGSTERVHSGWRGVLALTTSYAPGLLVAASVALFAAMSSFLRSADDFETGQAAFAQIGPFWFEFMSGWGPMSRWNFYFRQMFWPGLFSVAVLIVGIAALRWVGRTRSAQTPAAE